MQPDYPALSPWNSLTQNWSRASVASSPFQPVPGLQSEAARAICTASSTWESQNSFGDSLLIQSQQGACAIPTALPSNYVQSVENHYCFQSSQCQDVISLRQNPYRAVDHEARIFGPTELDFRQHLLETSASDRSGETLADSRPSKATETRGLRFIDDKVMRPQRGRTVFSAKQLLDLEKIFATDQYISGQQRRRLSSHLGLTETQVRVWFQNRRIKWRKKLERKTKA
ncbi:PREDICTED: NK1 transcription factor-related protein 1-like isoform X1 [Acropora digitifera]|uniref:NK1 transcription factor-related protein 1-like isoform X1 n=1 Tax=Acropora digitifera TaxID=70779 RepID=UPI00077AAA69|nr:PREDICTED: NK1 transcription factor-related protein 1-like isoform X1 [Acropora digitifera]